MTFTWPVLLWVLLLLPFTIWLLWRADRRRTVTAKSFADAHLLGEVVRRPPKAHVRWPLALQLLALGLFLFSASRPVATPVMPGNKASVMIAIDTSKSMLATDLNPTRLEAARFAAKEFLKVAPPSTQIGLVSFSDTATVLVPPTTNREVMLETIDRLKPAQNTSLAAAIITGVRSLPGRKDIKPPEELQPRGFGQQDPNTFTFPDQQPQSDKPEVKPENLPPGSILIVSDGATNVSANPDLQNQQAMDIAAKFAKDNGVKLYTLPVGREGGTTMQLQGQTYYVPFEPKNLQQLADKTEGKNIYPPDQNKLKEVFKELGTVIRWEPTKLEISSLLSGLAMVLMLIGGALSLRWQRRVP